MCCQPSQVRDKVITKISELQEVVREKLFAVGEGNAAMGMMRLFQKYTMEMFPRRVADMN